MITNRADHAKRAQRGSCAKANRGFRAWAIAAALAASACPGGAGTGQPSGQTAAQPAGLPAKQLTAKLKQATTPQALADGLLALGLTKPALDSALADDYFVPGGSLLAKAYLKRAETFPAKLIEGPETQSVSQIVFQSPVVQNESRRVYFILSHAGPAGQHKLLDRRVFDLRHCEINDAGAMTFSLAKGAGKAAKTVEVQFKVDQVEGCGTALSGSERTDTLSFPGGKAAFRPGAEAQDEPVDRMDLGDED